MDINAKEEEYKDSSYFVRCRGLPYSANEKDIKKFFEGLNTKEIVFTNSVDGKPSGECYVEFEDPNDCDQALQKDRQSIGSRYIEGVDLSRYDNRNIILVFTIAESELNDLIRRLEVKKETANRGFVRIRGLPYSCKKEDITRFFQGFTVEEVVFGKEPGAEGRPTGEGFVCFGSSAEADRALQLNGQHIGSRYIEIFKSDGGAFEAFKDRSLINIVPLRDIAPNPHDDSWYRPPGNGYQQYDNYDPRYDRRYDDYGTRRGGKNGRVMRGGSGYGGGYDRSSRYYPYGGGGGYAGRGGPPMGYRSGGDGYGYGGERQRPNPNKVYMRGLPFRVTPSEVEDFFNPLICVDIRLGVLPDGKSSGDGFVEFGSYGEARQALGKDREMIGNRYIELFNPSATKIPDDVYYESVGGKGRAPVFHQDPPAPPPEERPYQSEYAKYSGHEQYLPVPDEKYQPTGYPGSSSGHEAYGNGQQTMGYGASSSQPYQQQQQQSYDPYAQSYYSSYSNSNSKGDYNWP